MWLILSDGFLSAVVDKQDPEVIQVRARRKEHLSKYFPTKEVVTHDYRDYQFRVIVNREELQAMLVQYVSEMMYSNFKDSTTDKKFHDACYDVWHVMAGLQPKPPYSAYSGKGAQRAGFFDDPAYENHRYSGQHRSATHKKGR
jgi:hypothetical protein